MLRPGLGRGLVGRRRSIILKNAIRFAASAALGIAQALVIAALIVLPLSISPSKAQFADQSTWIATPGGSANAITLPVANWVRNLPGVPIHFLPGADNTTAVTIVVNGVGSPVALLQKNNTGLTALSGGELRSGQWATIAYDGTQWVLDDPLGKYTHASTLANSALSFGAAINLQINATVSTNALTIALKTAAGADATATTPILIPFRDVTIANGDPVIVPVTAALSFTIGSTNTMGCVSAQMCRLWIVAINNGGTAALCAFNALSGTSIAPINEAALQTSASGTSGGSSAQTYYCSTSAVTAKAIRILGYVEIQEVTAGTWATGPTYTQLFGPGIKKPGDVVQTVVATTTSSGTTTANSFTILTGGQTKSIAPTSAANIIRVFSTGTINVTGNVVANLQQARGSSTPTTLIGNPASVDIASSGASQNISILTYDVPNTTTNLTYGFQGFVASSILQYPQSGYGATLEIQEMMSALPEPTNDNGTIELRMVG